MYGTLSLVRKIYVKGMKNEKPNSFILFFKFSIESKRERLSYGRIEGVKESLRERDREERDRERLSQGEREYQTVYLRFKIDYINLITICLYF